MFQCSADREEWNREDDLLKQHSGFRNLKAKHVLQTKELFVAPGLPRSRSVEMIQEVVLLVLFAFVVCFSLEYLRALVFRPCGAACSSTAVGSHSGSRQTNRDELFADRRIGRRASLCQL